MPRRPSGQNTIHHVDTEIDIFDKLFRCTDAHKIVGGLDGKMLNGGFDNFACKLARLPDAKPTNCVSWKSDLDCSLGRFLPQSWVHSALNDSKQRLSLIRKLRDSRPRLSTRAEPPR